jgi:nitroreductase
MRKINPEQFDEIIHQRRSVFPQDYSGERVQDQVVNQILENARWAPTHKLTEPWRFLVFTGEGIKALAKSQAAIYKKVTVANGTFKDKNYENLLTKPLLSSHIIVVAMKRDERSSVPEIEEIGAVFCAIQNMYLTATAHGVACYLSTGGVTYFEESKAAFGLNAADRILGFFHLGMSEKVYPTSKRKSLEEVSSWITSA